jgi:hypothetical protein
LIPVVFVVDGFQSPTDKPMGFLFPTDVMEVDFASNDGGELFRFQPALKFEYFPVDFGHRVHDLLA